MNSRGVWIDVDEVRDLEAFGVDLAAVQWRAAQAGSPLALTLDAMAEAVKEDDQEWLLSARWAAAVLDVSDRYIRNAAQTGRLPGKKVSRGGRREWRFRLRDVERLNNPRGAARRVLARYDRHVEFVWDSVVDAMAEREEEDIPVGPYTPTVDELAAYMKRSAVEMRAAGLDPGWSYGCDGEVWLGPLDG